MATVTPACHYHIMEKFPYSIPTPTEAKFPYSIPTCTQVRELLRKTSYSILLIIQTLIRARSKCFSRFLGLLSYSNTVYVCTVIPYSRVL